MSEIMQDKKNNGATIGCLLYFAIPAIVFLILLFAFQETTGLDEDFAFEIIIAIFGIALIGYAIYDSLKKK